MSLINWFCKKNKEPQVNRETEEKPRKKTLDELEAIVPLYIKKIGALVKKYGEEINYKDFSIKVKFVYLRYESRYNYCELEINEGDQKTTMDFGINSDVYDFFVLCMRCYQHLKSQEEQKRIGKLLNKIEEWDVESD